MRATLKINSKRDFQSEYNDLILKEEDLDLDIQSEILNICKSYPDVLVWGSKVYDPVFGKQISDNPHHLSGQGIKSNLRTLKAIYKRLNDAKNK